MTHNTDEAIGRLVGRYKDTQNRIATLKSDLLVRAEHMATLGDALKEDADNVVLTDRGYEVTSSGTGLGTLPDSRPTIPYEFADELRELMVALHENEEIKAKLWECVEESGINTILRK